VEEVAAVMGAVTGPVVAMEEVEVMVGLEVEVVAIVNMGAHMEQEGVDIQEEAMEDMVGVAMVVMEGEDMEEAVVMVAVAMVDMVDLDMGVLWVVRMEGMASMEEEQGGLADHSQDVTKVTVLGR
jgi:hypothetical protein